MLHLNLSYTTPLPHYFFFLLLRPPPRSTLFPYTTLFRSWEAAAEMAWPCSTVRLTSESGSLKSKRVVNDDAVLLEHCGNGQSIPGQMQPLYLGYERASSILYRDR